MKRVKFDACRRFRGRGHVVNECHSCCGALGPTSGSIRFPGAVPAIMASCSASLSRPLASYALCAMRLQKLMLAAHVHPWSAELV